MTRKLLPLLFGLITVAVHAQTLQSIVPNSGNAGQTLNVTITGSNTHFLQGSGTYIDFGFSQGSNTVNSINIISNTTITANITIPFTTYTGYYDVYTYDYTDGYLFKSNGFYVNGVTPPAITSVNPNHAVAGQTLNVTITGSNTSFSQGSGVYFVDFSFSQGTGTTAANYFNVVNDTSISANITVPPSTPDGNYDVNVYGDMDGYLQLINGFHVGASGIPETRSDLLFDIIPNPCSDMVTVHALSPPANGENTIYIYNLRGELVLQEPMNEMTKRLNISSLSKGLYLLKVQGSAGVALKRFVVL